MTTLEILRAARAKIERPECWWKGGFGTIDRRASVVAGTVADGLGCAWCAYGAVIAAAGNLNVLAAVGLLEKHAGCHRTGIGPWNDDPERTHAQVLAVFDSAIAELS